MLNQTVLVGRLTSEIERKEIDGKSYVTCVLAVPRSYKNENGEYDTDFIQITLWQGIADNVKEYCRKGDMIGVKGRIESKVVEAPIGNHYEMSLIAEKVTFLSSKKDGE